MVCLAVLIRRASDKSAAVRGKAVSLLGAVVAEALGAASSDSELGTFRRVWVMVQFHRPWSMLTQLCH